jgi:hypothetical protein
MALNSLIYVKARSSATRDDTAQSVRHTWRVLRRLSKNWSLVFLDEPVKRGS